MNRNMNLFERFRTDKFDQSNDAIILQGKQMGGGKIANYLKLSAQLLTQAQNASESQVTRRRGSSSS